MMKLLLTVLLCPIFFNGIAQRNTDSLFFVSMKNRKIILSEKPAAAISNLPFHEVTVLDVRPDTTSIGFLKYANGTNKLYLEKGLAKTFKDFINADYKLNTDTNNLLILIKEFRVTDYAAHAGIKSNNQSKWNSGAILSIELFLKNNSNYHALYKIDSILLAESNQETVAALVEESFRIILMKPENKNLSEMHIGKAAFSLQDIKNHIADFTNYPILKALTPNRGVYKSFYEFKNDNPSIKDFEVKKGEFTDELLITEDNQTYPLQNFWGYSDGKNLFMRSADNLFQLERVGNTFNIKGIKSFSQKYNKNVGNEVASSYFIGVPMSAFVKNNYKADITAFQLNMQTGEIY